MNNIFSLEFTEKPDYDLLKDILKSCVDEASSVTTKPEASESMIDEEDTNINVRRNNDE